MTVDAKYLTVVALGLLVASSVAEDDPGRPVRLAIEPNAILRSGRPLEVQIEGVPRGRPARIWVVEDCDGDGRPDDGVDCPRLYEVESEPADRRGVVEHRLDFTELNTEFPKGVTLWLRASRPDSPRFRQAMFGFVEDECSIFRTVTDVFARGRCRPGLAQVLRRHRQPTDLVNTLFEVRRITVDGPPAEPVPVGRTRGASGVAWLEAGTLLVTSTGSAEEDSLAPGLYRVPLAEGAVPERLWSPSDGEPGAVAPFHLPCGRVAFVSQKPGAQRLGADEEPARLLVLRLKTGIIAREIPLPYKVHQLVAADAEGLSVLALSLGVADNRPLFMKVDVDDERAEPEVLGFSGALYQSLMREPGGERSSVAFENAFADHGWQIVLADGPELVRDLVKRDGRHDLAPAWRPQGGELAYLAQVGERR